MSLTPFPTDLHDAGVEQCTFDLLRGQLTISLLLDAANGIRVVRKQLLLSGISNGKEVTHFQKQVDRAIRKKGKGNRSRLGYRLEDVSYCTPLASGKAELAIRLAIDHLPVLLIQCEKIAILDLV
ncbi:MAG: hypothetical protein ACRYFX_30990 [Janthinobacterium lividum]